MQRVGAIGGLDGQGRFPGGRSLDVDGSAVIIEVSLDGVVIGSHVDDIEIEGGGRRGDIDQG